MQVATPPTASEFQGGIIGVTLRPVSGADLISPITALATHPQQRVYRECGRCRKPDAKLKCACLATHYCDTQCQREDMPEHRQECTFMTLKEINLIQNQLIQHKANHGKFIIEVARLELLSTETHVKLADLFRFSGPETNQKGSEYHYMQALLNVARLEKLTFLRERPSLLHNLRIDQAAAHLGLGSLYRDQHSLVQASEQLTQAHDVTQELIRIGDSPGQQDRLGVILTTHGEILNRQGQLQTSDRTTPKDGYTALDKQRRAVRISANWNRPPQALYENRHSANSWNRSYLWQTHLKPWNFTKNPKRQCRRPRL